MKKQGILIVGEQFSTLYDNENILGFHQLDDFLNSLNDSSKKHTIYIGQGLSDMQLSDIKYKASCCSSQITVLGELPKLTRAEYPQTEMLSIISEPEKISNKSFQSYLMLNSTEENQCTGLNQSFKISETTMLKACSQFTHLVLNEQLLNPNESFNKIFTFYPVEINFFAVLYPVDTTIRLNIQHIRQGLNSNLKATGSIDIIQNETIAGTLNVDFALLDKDIHLDIEKEVALSSIRNQLNPPRF